MHAPSPSSPVQSPQRARAQSCPLVVRNGRALCQQFCVQHRRGGIIHHVQLARDGVNGGFGPKARVTKRFAATTRSHRRYTGDKNVPDPIVMILNASHGGSPQLVCVSWHMCHKEHSKGGGA